ncbi:hypothetical protein, partial [Gordonia sp. (in: high G+C Gram-positive bacteria)]
VLAGGLPEEGEPIPQTRAQIDRSYPTESHRDPELEFIARTIRAAADVLEVGQLWGSLQLINQASSDLDHYLDPDGEYEYDDDTTTQSAPISDRQAPPPRTPSAKDQKNGLRVIRPGSGKSNDLIAEESSDEALLPEDPAEAIAARKQDPRFSLEDPGADDIGEESQDPGDHE